MDEEIKNEETVEEPAKQPENAEKPISPLEAAEQVASGKIGLKVPITDGDRVYESLNYDFNKLTGWEIAQAMDEGSSMSKSRSNDMGRVSRCQCLCLFAAAAAKCTDGLDATDIRERMSSQDVFPALNLADIFFRGSLLAGSMRITKE